MILSVALECIVSRPPWKFSKLSKSSLEFLLCLTGQDWFLLFAMKSSDWHTRPTLKSPKQLLFVISHQPCHLYSHKQKSCSQLLAPITPCAVPLLVTSDGQSVLRPAGQQLAGVHLGSRSREWQVDQLAGAHLRSGLRHLAWFIRKGFSQPA